MKLSAKEILSKYRKEVYALIQDSISISETTKTVKEVAVAVLKSMTEENPNGISDRKFWNKQERKNRFLYYINTVVGNSDLHTFMNA